MGSDLLITTLWSRAESGRFVRQKEQGHQGLVNWGWCWKEWKLQVREIRLCTLMEGESSIEFYSGTLSSLVCSLLISASLIAANRK